jgi:GH35 family endo-1,4-beta-xylanase
MKATTILVLLAVLITACKPAATPEPTVTFVPATTKSLPPTITPTLAPENLADAKDLSVWVGNFVNAHGEKVDMDGVEMDLDQLLKEIASNPDAYIETRKVNGISYLFLLINGIPLAVREGAGQWEELTSRKIVAIFKKTGDVFEYFGAQFSNPFSVNTGSIVDEVFAAEFNAAFLNDAYWHVVEQREGFPDFTDALDAARKAKEDGMFVVGGQLVDPRGEFDYTYLKNKRDLTRDQLLSIMTNHISAEMGALKGYVDAYIVVNESRPVTALMDGNPEDPFNTIIGEDYIEIAFQTAREADPNAILIYNDGNNHHPSHDYTNGSNNTPRTLEVVSRLRAKGLIDGVGLQMHIFADEPPDMDKMIKTFQEYGVPVYVTELDINMDNLKGTDLEKTQLQEKLYREVLTAILRSNVTVMVSHWTAIADTAGNQGQLFDFQLRPTRNLYMERSILFEYYQGR